MAITHSMPVMALEPPLPALGKPGTEAADALFTDELLLLPVGGVDAPDPEEGGGEAVHAGTLIVSLALETVPPNAKACPAQVTVLPIVMPAASISVPANVELAPKVVAPVGVQKTSQTDALPARLTTELAPVVSAPLGLNI